MHEPLDKVTRRLYCPFRGASVVAEVNLAEKKSNGAGRWPLTRESRYEVSKYGTRQGVRQLDLSSNDFIVIRVDGHKYEDGYQGKVVISYPQIHEMRVVLAELMRDLPGLFNEETGDLLPAGERYGLQFTGHAGAVILFRPWVLGDQDDQGESIEPGVRMFLNTESHYVDATLDGFLAFAEMMIDFDLQQFAISAAQVAAIAYGVSNQSHVSAAQPRRRG